MERSNGTDPLRILVVDDCPDTTMSLTLLLQMWGYAVRVAPDGATALALAEDFRPEVVLLDVAMPGMDGCEVARQLRQRPASPRPYLLGVSGYGQERDRRRSLDAGIDDHWIKPVEPEQLHRLLESFQAAAAR
jgi:CheY-like chemotaxis protein